MSLATRVGSLIWSSGSKIARVLADTGALHATKLDSYVISVGNLQAGGSGKTPLVAQVAREAFAKGKSVCILTRGYGGECETTGAILRPRADSEKSSAMSSTNSVTAESHAQEILNPRKFGDEAVLLHDLVPEAWIAIGADRVRQYHEASNWHGGPFDVTILDDGFQHWKILKDRDILAVTSNGPSETFHRDFLTEAKRADLLVWTKGDTRPAVMDASGKPSVKVRYRLETTTADRVCRFWLISAIGDARSFRKSIEASGLHVERETKLSDHAEFSGPQIEKWIAEAQTKHLRIAVTGKDWVKWRAFGNFSESVSVFEPSLVFESGRDHWESVLWS